MIIYHPPGEDPLVLMVNSVLQAPIGMSPLGNGQRVLVSVTPAGQIFNKAAGITDLSTYPMGALLVIDTGILDEVTEDE
jgi:hypothetical protein